MKKSIDSKERRDVRRTPEELAIQGFKVIDIAYFVHSWRALPITRSVILFPIQCHFYIKTSGFFNGIIIAWYLSE
jgi:hypothetical protein